MVDFPGWLDMLGSVGRLNDMIGQRRLSLRAALRKLATYYQKAVSVPAITFFMEAEVEGKGLKEVRVRTIGEVLVWGRKGERVRVDVAVRNGADREFGSLQHLGRRAERWRDTCSEVCWHRG